MCAQLLSLLIVLIGKGNRKGESRPVSLSQEPQRPSEAIRICCSIMAPVYILPKLIFCQQLMQSRNLESWLIARFADNCFINSSWLPLFPARHMGPSLRRAWQQFLNEGEMEQPASLPLLIPWVSAGFFFFFSSHTQCVKGIPCFQASGNLQRSISLKAGGGTQQGTRFMYSLHILFDRMTRTFVLNKYQFLHSYKITASKKMSTVRFRHHLFCS